LAHGFREATGCLRNLQEFFLSEIQAEVHSGFTRLARIPESHVVDKLHYYGLLGETEKRASPRLQRVLGKHVLRVRRKNA